MSIGTRRLVLAEVVYPKRPAAKTVTIKTRDGSQYKVPKDACTVSNTPGQDVLLTLKTAKTLLKAENAEPAPKRRTRKAASDAEDAEAAPALHMGSRVDGMILVRLLLAEELLRQPEMEHVDADAVGTLLDSAWGRVAPAARTALLSETKRTEDEAHLNKAVLSTAVSKALRAWLMEHDEEALAACA
eukprot:TRINITY_DN2034_c0_g4_i2.p2 TRINITY_DN2034_c0_g4~~TRINITY_DN2034_c0_g4_i2.p2  ORF type:complete len:187 (+),score=59.45 TRINITY_DN2034_c0_g4_i2:799-1359(+)